MLKYFTNISIFCLVFTTLASAAEIENYQVHIEGTDDPSIIENIQENSKLIELQDRPPKTELALKHRSVEDIPNLIKSLHSLAYYNAHIHLDYDFSQSPPLVTIQIDPGPVYPLADMTILPECLNITYENLGIVLGEPALPANILQAEEYLIDILNKQGYPLAKITKRDVVADQTTKEVSVTFEVKEGPLASFGTTTIIGEKGVLECFVRNKIKWCEGERYDPELIDKTLTALESTGLFKTISITLGDMLEDESELPIQIEVDEAKHRSIGFGVGYSSQRGPGVTFQWENRNIFSMGERLYFESNLLWKTQEVKLSFLKPDYLVLDQDLVLTSELKRDLTKGYHEESFTIGAALERQLTERTRVSQGVMYKQLKTTKAQNDGDFNLLKFPFQYKWYNTDDILDPKIGSSFYFKTVPTVQFLDKPFFYVINQMIGSAYFPLEEEGKFVLASKINIGTIIGGPDRSIPTPEKFFAGSENTLRGYNYYTVSPLDHHDDPIGGRSMAIFTLEGRWKITDEWGAVAFFDAGNVYKPAFPDFNKKVLKSVGIGGRYYTPVGPLRLDVAFPLDRRKHLDSWFQIYFSVGQSF
jgi:translocation and assembly module TamA